MKYQDYAYETNSRVIKMFLKEKNLSCSYCPPNRVENSNRRNKSLSRCWKVKGKRRKRWEVPKQPTGYPLY